VQINWLGICVEIMIDYLDQIYGDEGMVKKFQEVTESALSVADYISTSESAEDKKQAAVLLSSGLGLLLQETFQYRLSLQAYEKALFIKYKYDKQNCFVEHFNLAKMLNELEDFNGSIKYNTLCIRERQRKYGKHDISLIDFYIEIAGCYSQQNDYFKAIQNCLTCIDILAKCDNSVDGFHVYVFEVYLSLAEIYFLYGDYKESANYSIRALRVCNANFEKDDYYYFATCRVYFRISKIYVNIDDYVRALRWLNKELKVYNQFDDSFNGITEQKSRVYDLMGSVYIKQDEFDKAIDCFLFVQNAEKALHSENSPEAALALNNLGYVYGEMEDWEKAFTKYNVALDILSQCFGEHHTDTMLVYYNMAYDYCTKKDYQQSVFLINKVIDYFIDKCGGYNSNLADAYLNMARTLRHSAKLYEALDYYKKALLIQKRIFCAYHTDIGLTCKSIADTLFELKSSEATGFYLQAKEVYEKALGKNSDRVIGINEQIAKCEGVLC
jgi:tetratricopeptide (TPR) repeat protein